MKLALQTQLNNWYKITGFLSQGGFGIKHRDIPAMVNLGWMYETGKGVNKNESLALKYYTDASKLNNPAGQYSLGNMYYRGLGCNKDLKIALEYYKKAAVQDYPHAIAMLGYMNEYGEGGLEVNLSEAGKCYRKAAGLGDEWSKEQLQRF
jgi:hypothetical protein